MRTEAILDVNMEMRQTLSRYPGFDQRGAKHNVNAPGRVVGGLLSLVQIGNGCEGVRVL